MHTWTYIVDNKTGLEVTRCYSLSFLFLLCSYFLFLFLKGIIVGFPYSTPLPHPFTRSISSFPLVRYAALYPIAETDKQSTYQTL
jgi:hypothetical protein